MGRRNAKTKMSKKTNHLLQSSCEICNKRPIQHTHHIDFNHKNNKPENIQYLCTRCHAEIHGIEWRISELRKLIDYYKRAQKARIRFEHYLRAYSFMELIVPIIIDKISLELEQLEKNCKKEIDKYFKEEKNQTDIYKWLISIKGISNILAGQLISRIDIDKTPGIANLWSYCGLKPEDKKRKGNNAKWNHHLKSVCYLLADEFIKQRTPKYRDIYDKEKEKQLGQGLKKGHADNRARRKMVKIFLKDLWLEWEKDQIANGTQRNLVVPVPQKRDGENDHSPIETQ